MSGNQLFGRLYKFKKPRIRGNTIGEEMFGSMLTALQ